MFKSAFGLVVAASVFFISGCQPPAAPKASDALGSSMSDLDIQQLPNDQWRLSRAVIELSFCRNRVNEALLASEMELNGWRLTGDVSAFPPYRKEGLTELQRLLQDQAFLLWQRDGSVSAQRYYIALPASYSKGDVAEQVFPAVATLASETAICHAAVVEQ